MMSEAAWVNFLIIIFLLSFAAIFFLKAKGKGIITIITVIIFSLLTGFHAVRSLTGTAIEIVLSGTAMFGDVPLRIDAMSGWFILVINFTMLTGAFYGLNYMKKYRERESDLTFHCMAWLLVHLTLVGVCAIQNSFIFLLFWEILALAVFILVIFDSSKPGTVKAGLNYLVQSHISIVFLMMGFIYYAFKTNSYSFDAIRSYSSGQSSLEGTAVFLLFFIGFALKAGFIPFHTWLPYAHPAAPSHVSGIMSGVVIKIDIFGILSMLL
jgi:formate hydrogenlyase subunit 3/multisubunit Na+/H+ antiporter MnhD subunit